MDSKEYERLLELIESPPPGSKLAVAKLVGVNLRQMVENLRLSPTQRLEKMASAVPYLAALRRAANEAIDEPESDPPA